MTETSKNRQKGKKWRKGRKRRDELGKYIHGPTCSCSPCRSAFFGRLNGYRQCLLTRMIGSPSPHPVVSSVIGLPISQRVRGKPNPFCGEIRLKALD